MKNSGFTLVELLAVILILSLLTVLATTSVTKIVKDSKNRLYKAQIESIRASAESWGADHLGVLPDTGQCAYLTLKNLKNSGLVDDEVRDPKSNQLFSDDLKIKITAKHTSSGSNKFEYEVGVDIDGCYKAHYDNGDIVYFDVSKGLQCTEVEYSSSLGTYEKSVLGLPEVEYVKDYGNSETYYNGIDNKDENQNSCLKFYAFNDLGTDTLNLLLDHNLLFIASIGGYTDTLVNELKNAVKDWKGVKTPKNYSFVNKNADTISDLNSYTIDYTDSKARFITAEEIATIVGLPNNQRYDKGTVDWYYFESINQNQSPTQQCSKSQSCQYAWLYDRLRDCKENYGCLNDEIGSSAASEYFTITINPKGLALWEVYGSGKIGYKVSDNEIVTSMGGIRPVIEVDRFKLK